MTLDEMWARLEAHQPFADQGGYGPAWKRMCDDRTEDVADATGNLLWRERKQSAAWAAWSASYALRNLKQVSMWLGKAEESNEQR